MGQGVIPVEAMKISCCQESDRLMTAQLELAAVAPLRARACTRPQAPPLTTPEESRTALTREKCEALRTDLQIKLLQMKPNLHCCQLNINNMF